MVNEQKEFAGGVRSKSAEKIEAAFVELMRTRSFADVSVIDICEAADVARKTFYRNYDSKAHVIERIADAAFATFLEKTDVATADSRSMYMYWFEFMIANRAFANTITDLDVSAIIMEKIIGFMETVFDDAYHNSVSLDPALSGYYLRFFAVGLMSIMKSWVENDCKTPPKTMAALSERLLYGVTQLIR